MQSAEVGDKEVYPLGCLVSLSIILEGLGGGVECITGAYYKFSCNVCG
jgi:hypothetical protein